MSWKGGRSWTLDGAPCSPSSLPPRLTSLLLLFTSPPPFSPLPPSSPGRAQPVAPSSPPPLTRRGTTSGGGGLYLRWYISPVTVSVRRPTTRSTSSSSATCRGVGGERAGKQAGSVVGVGGSRGALTCFERAGPALRWGLERSRLGWRCVGVCVELRGATLMGGAGSEGGSSQHSYPPGTQPWAANSPNTRGPCSGTTATAAPCLSLMSRQIGSILTFTCNQHLR